jgi:hypothetical protein
MNQSRIGEAVVASWPTPEVEPVAATAAAAAAVLAAPDAEVDTTLLDCGPPRCAVDSTVTETKRPPSGTIAEEGEFA